MTGRRAVWGAFAAIVAGLLIAGCGPSDPDCPNGKCVPAGALCGNHVVEGDETCDGDCPTVCDDGDPCTTDWPSGSAEDCSAECTFEAIAQCDSGDGCCPSGCGAGEDRDCTAVCGNDLLEPGETCDGDCPAECSDALACTHDVLVGGDCTKECSYQSVVACADNDGCCGAGCDAGNDNDCSPTCGNGIVEATETCDGDCEACSDGDTCTYDIQFGTPQQCNVICDSVEVVGCLHNDGCCKPGCSDANDNDCREWSDETTVLASSGGALGISSEFDATVCGDERVYVFAPQYD